MSGALVKKSTTTITTTKTTTSGKPVRRGFGLFDSEDDGDSDSAAAAEAQRTPVRFTGDRSAFANMSDRSDSEGGIASRAKSSSRKSKLTTPSRKIATRRGTPYHATARVRRFQAAAESGADTDEERLISESVFGNSPAPKKKARFAPASPEDEREESTELDTDEEQKTPIRNRGTSRQKPAEKSKQQSEESSAINKKTWGQWLKGIVTHPVATLLTAHAPSKNDDDNRPKTPEAEYHAPEMPGSFEKTLALPPPPPPPPADPNYNQNYRFFTRDAQNTPVRNADGLFQSGISPFNFSSPASTASNGSASPASVKKGSRALTAPTAIRRMPPPAAVVSYRKPSNFIARMRGETKRGRFDPYSRPPSARKKKAPVAILPEEITKDLTPEEELELLERREKDRKVQEAEDRYLRREALRRMGKPVEDEEMSDTPTEPKKVKGKGKVATVDDMDEDEVDRAQTSNTPPDSPPRKQNPAPIIQDLAPHSSPPLFQFAPAARPTLTSEKRGPAELNSGERYSGFVSLFPPETDSDKENVHNPPPPPTMSHRELPAVPIPAPAPPASGTSLFPEKQPVGGFGISEGPVLQPNPVSPSMTRQRFDKFKPRVSSGLRESATVEKENMHDKENPSENPFNLHGDGAASPPSPGGKPPKAAFGTQIAPKPSTQISSSSALREVGGNAPAGTGVKVDIGGKIAAVCPHPTLDSWHASLTMVEQLPVKELSALVAWPGVEMYTTADTRIQAAVRAAWQVEEREWLGDWANGVFGGARDMVARV